MICADYGTERNALTELFRVGFGTLILKPHMHFQGVCGFFDKDIHMKKQSM